MCFECFDVGIIDMVEDNMVVDNMVVGILDFDIVMVVDEETEVVGCIHVFVVVEIVAENHHYHYC